jgi:hypothetical protein
MPYLILKSDGTTLTTVPDGQFDSVTTSLNLIGKNLFEYGILQNQNFVRLLENFANSSAPTNQMRGQLWFDTTSNSLKYYTSTQWKNLAAVSVSSSSAASQELGNLWYDTTNRQLSINTGTGLTVIGPDGVVGFDTTRIVSTKIRDISNVEHPILLVYLDGEIVAIIAKTTFQINPLDSITGFTTLIRGINLKNDAVVLTGASTSATNADFLRNALSNSYIAASVAAQAETIVQRDASANIAANAITVNSITTPSSGTLAGAWSVNNNLLPTTNAGADLGSSVRRWGAAYVNSLNAAQLTGGAINFSTIVDPFLVSIGRFDTDGSLSANSDGRLPTQRAVKSYVDAAVAAGGGGGGGGFTGSRGFTGSAGTGTGALSISPPLLFHVTSGFTNGGRVIVKNTVPTVADLDSGTFQPGDIWFDPSGDTGYIQSANVNGWTKLPNGILIQWGRVNTFNTGEGAYGPFNFNTNFIATPWSVVATPFLINSNNGADVWLQVITSSITVSQFSVQYQRSTSPPRGIDGFTWIAIGPG